MKTHASASSVLHTFGTMLAVLSLCQCSMPPRQAWQYIQSNGLITYLNYSTGHANPPLRTGQSRQHYTTRPHRPSSTWFMNWGSGMPNRIQYSSSTYSPNRYYSPAPSYHRSQPAKRPRASNAAPIVRIPVDEPGSPPQIVRNESSATASTPSTAFTSPRNDTSTSAAPEQAGDFPFGTPVPGRLNMVNSPYAGKTQLVDVSGMGPGQTVKCPYTGKLFRVPVAQQATNTVEPRLESKIEPSQLSAPKPEETKP